jgi:hypothetical protein
MRIAIFDPRIQVPGLKLIFPEAEYYVTTFENKYNCDITPELFYSKYSFNYNENFLEILKHDYDILIIVYAFCDFKNFIHKDCRYHYDSIHMLVKYAKYKKLLCFANDDYDADPSEICKSIPATIWFKRNVQRNVTYANNVKPFPFMVFGYTCPLFTTLTKRYQSDYKYIRIMWAGALYNHQEPEWGVSRDRDTIYDDIKKACLTENIPFIRLSMPYDEYIKEITKSMFCVDLNGVGDPNIRFFEILYSNTIALRQYNECIWPFEDGDDWPSETQFKTGEELVENVKNIMSNESIYNNILAKQNFIVNKYFNISWLRNYIMNQLQLF